MLCIFSSPSLVFHFINSNLSSENHSPLLSHFSLYLFCFSKPFAAICIPFLKFIFNFLSPSQFLPHLYCSLSLSFSLGQLSTLCLCCVCPWGQRGILSSATAGNRTHTFLHVHTHVYMHACTHIGWISDCSTQLVLGRMHISKATVSVGHERTAVSQ